MSKRWKAISVQTIEGEYKKAKLLAINIFEILKKALGGKN
jgi:hypothetical protein